jgi:hypothetical protein
MREVPWRISTHRQNLTNPALQQGAVGPAMQVYDPGPSFTLTSGFGWRPKHGAPGMTEIHGGYDGFRFG